MPELIRSSASPTPPGTVSAMVSKPNDATFVAHQKVVAAQDLPGVPAGTRGKVMLRTGFSWIRYRVHFDNGVEIPWLEADQLVGPKDYEAPVGSST